MRKLRINVTVSGKRIKQEAKAHGYTRDMIRKKTLKEIYEIDMIVEDLDEYNRKVCLFESI